MLDLPNGLAQRRAHGVGLPDGAAAHRRRQDATPSPICQLRLPVVVIGGGLTAIDTATESLAYYPVQVEKFLARYEALAAEHGEAGGARAAGRRRKREIADEFLAHARAIRAERAAAAREGRRPHLIELLDAWGGVTIAYRRRLIDARAIRSTTRKWPRRWRRASASPRA